MKKISFIWQPQNVSNDQSFKKKTKNISQQIYTKLIHTNQFNLMKESFYKSAIY